MPGYESFSYYYDRLTENVDYPALCDYLCGIFADCGINGGILLDAACGTGTLSVLMSGKGFDVIGTDASADMLSEAQNKMYESGRDILFLCQSFEELNLYGTVDAAICTLDGINHLTDEKDVQTAFDKISLFMNPGGVFVFDVNTVYKHRCVLADNTFVYDLDDVYCVWQNYLDRETDTVEMSLDIFEADGDGWYRSSDSVTERAYTDERLQKMLANAGFEVVSVYDFMSRSTVRENSEKAVYVCRKRA
ncbi:MAG: class I SAM-dependent methyltransferase [Clostridia bacterium]|nr:class I SAM-dependent methyltransferase [Clostridia bacterium]